MTPAALITPRRGDGKNEKDEEQAIDRDGGGRKRGAKTWRSGEKQEVFFPHLTIPT